MVELRDFYQTLTFYLLVHRKALGSSQNQSRQRIISFSVAHKIPLCLNYQVNKIAKDIHLKHPT